MEFTINRDAFLKSLGHASGIVEKKTTLPILSNILIEAKGSVSRPDIRMALAQLLDYKRFCADGVELAVLMPELPRPDLCDLL